MQDFCRAVCGFHYFKFPSLVGHTLPYAWVGHSSTQCPDVCAYPFAIPSYMAGGGVGAMRPSNGDVITDGMVSVVAHELAELATNPLGNAWYAVNIHVWMKYPTFEATVQNAWNTKVQGMNIFVVARKKRKAVKEALKLWNRETDGNIKSSANSIRFELETIYKL